MMIKERPRRLIDDCFLHDKDRLRHDEVLALIDERLSPVADVERVALDVANGRVLASPVVAPRNIPDFSNAAVDGFAFAASSLGEGETSLTIAARIQAGEMQDIAVGPGEAVRIFTGAPMPVGADTCIMQEDAVVHGNQVTVPAGTKAGINVRAAGEDVCKGSVIAEPGRRLRPQELAQIASTGTGEIDVFKRLRVAVFSTGDEIIRPGTAIKRGQVYDSNHYLLAGLLETVDADVTDLGILPDERETVRKAVTEAAGRQDVILTSGGASRGDADFVVETIESIGSLHAWQIAIKPGRPLAFGQIGDTVFLGMPGNPVAVFVCFLLYAQPAFARLQGAEWRPPQRYAVPAGFDIARKKPDRREFLRGWVEDDGKTRIVQKYAQDGSGLISGLSRAGGLIEIAEHMTQVRRGDPVDFIPFGEFGL
jgi:molybdopterin molybdotransferase